MYPKALESLVPELLDAGALASSKSPQESYPWEYESDGLTYTLRFRYSGPGMNVSTYKPRASHWVCGGYL